MGNPDAAALPPSTGSTANLNQLPAANVQENGQKPAIKAPKPTPLPSSTEDHYGRDQGEAKAKDVTTAKRADTPAPKDPKQLKDPKVTKDVPSQVRTPDPGKPGEVKETQPGEPAKESAPAKEKGFFNKAMGFLKKLYDKPIFAGGALAVGLASIVTWLTPGVRELCLVVTGLIGLFGVITCLGEWLTRDKNDPKKGPDWWLLFSSLLMLTGLGGLGSIGMALAPIGSTVLGINAGCKKFTQHEEPPPAPPAPAESKEQIAAQQKKSEQERADTERQRLEAEKKRNAEKPNSDKAKAKTDQDQEGARIDAEKKKTLPPPARPVVPPTSDYDDLPAGWESPPPKKS